MNLFQSALKMQNSGRPPVWFMRQAGRYHSHYQALRARYSFTDLCKIPKVACEATLGPIRDFDFDAAILFSDLLFPLEVMGMGLTYEPGPKLSWHLKNLGDLDRLQGGAALAHELDYQGEALKLIRAELSPTKGLLGFVGGPFTLFSYAAEGSHQGGLLSAREGLRDGRFDGFVEKLVPLLAENMALQARAGADVVAILDTCAGELEPSQYRERVVPTLRATLKLFKQSCPKVSVLYYSKSTGPEHWDALKDLPLDGIGVDWNHNLAEVLGLYGDRWAIQGNIDPHWLFLEPLELESRVRKVFSEVKALDPKYLRGWICGLGHGVLPKTPESNVKLVLRIQKEMFS